MLLFEFLVFLFAFHLRIGRNAVFIRYLFHMVKLTRKMSPHIHIHVSATLFEERKTVDSWFPTFPGYTRKSKTSLDVPAWPYHGPGALKINQFPSHFSPPRNGQFPKHLSHLQKWPKSLSGAFKSQSPKFRTSVFTN